MIVADGSFALRGVMNRQNFLQTQWRSYPSALPSQDFVYGRVKTMSSEELKIQGPLGVSVINQFGSTLIDDEKLGTPIPLSCLQEGDVVAYQKSTYALFLLSPRLSPLSEQDQGGEARWSGFLKQVESYFEGLHFLHLRTPFLVPSPGVDHHIDFMKVSGVRTGRQWFLPTSPEIHLKKYLCRGYDQIFEIKSCFRDDLDSPLHQAEFTMLEWYRTYVGLEIIKTDLMGLLETLAEKQLEFKSLTVAQCFESVLNFKLQPDTSRAELIVLAQSIKIDLAENDDWNDLFFRIFMEKIEPFLAEQGLCFLEKFPPQQASLSRIDSEGWSERFEFFASGVELANAYHELNDPLENQRRFQEEMRLRQSRDAELSGQDLDFFEELKNGMPPASGIALGLSRLYQCWPLLNGPSLLKME